MKDASDNDSVGASISAETSNVTRTPAVTEAPAVTIPLVTVTATQSSEEPALISNKDKKKTSKKKARRWMVLLFVVIFEFKIGILYINFLHFAIVTYNLA